MRLDVSGKIIEKFKEIISLKDEQCDHQCNECLLSEIIKEIWYECDYEEIDICEAINLIKNKIK